MNIPASPRRKTGSARVTGCLILICVFAGGFIWYRGSDSSEPELPEGAAKVQAQAKILSLNMEKEAVMRDSAKHRAHPFHFSISEGELNLLLATDNNTLSFFQRHKVRKAFVKISDGCIHATAIRPVGGISVAIKMDIVPDVTPNRQLNLRVESVKVGMMKLPPDLLKKITDKVIGVLTKQISGALPKVDVIRALPGQLIVEGNSV